MFLSRITKRSLGLEVFVKSTICVFFSTQMMGCPPPPPFAPPQMTVVEPENGFTDQDDQNVTLTFSQGTAPINTNSFSGLQNDESISSLFNIDAQGADAVIPLYDGANMLNFSVQATDGGSDEAFACVYKLGAEDPPIVGEINVLTPSQFDTQVYSSMNAPNALSNYVADYGVSAHSFSEPMQAQVEAEGHSFLVYTATLAKPQGVGFRAAVNPNERISLVQVVLPYSITHGSIVRDYTFLIIQNEIDKYLIVDNGEGGSFRIDYLDPEDPGTWTTQWFWNGDPTDPQGAVMMRGLSAGCWAAIGGALFATITATTISITAPGAGWAVAVWITGKASSAFGLFTSCRCDMGGYSRCN